MSSETATTASRVPWLLAILAGLALGVGYAASPLTIWFLVAMLGLLAWAGHGLPHHERRVVWTLLGAAVVVRLIAVIVLALTSDPHQVESFFWDGDGPYFKMRTLWRRNVWSDVPVPPLYFQGAFDVGYAWTTLIPALAYLQYLMGPARYGLHLVNVALYLTSVVLLYRLVRPAYGRVTALVGLAVLLFMPTLFAWSVSTLKEPPLIFLFALAIAAALSIVRNPGLRSRALALVGLAATVAIVEGVRPGGRLVAVGGLAVGLAATVVIRRAWLVLLVALVMGTGGVLAMRDPVVQARITGQLVEYAGRNIGNVSTEGYAYKLLDQRFYAGSAENAPQTMTMPEGMRFVARSLVSVVLYPLPWQMHSVQQLVYLPQQVLWYVLVGLAFGGAVAGLRRDALLTCLLVGIASVGAAGVGINSGNFGTMVRHRDMIVPFMVWLSALGGVTMLTSWAARIRSRNGESTECR